MSKLKLKSLTLNNFHQFSEISVDFDPNLTFLSGANGSGKSTVGITALQAILEGIGLKGQSVLRGERFRFIGERSASAKGIIVLHDEEGDFDVTITRKFTKSDTTIKIEADKEGVSLDQRWLSSLFNSMMFNPNSFLELSGVDQAKAIGVDTEQFDTKIKSLKEEFTLLNRIYKDHGILEEVEAPEETGNISELLAKRDEIAEHNSKIAKAHERINENLAKIKDLQAQVAQLQANSLAIEKWLEGKEAIDLADTNDKISKAQQNSQAQAKYDAYLAKKAKMESDLAKIKANKAAQESATKERLDYIQAANMPFKNVTISDEGELLVNDKPLKPSYFSHGELIKIVAMLYSTLKPEFKYIFIQDFSLLDEENQAKLIDYLIKADFQVVCEVVNELPSASNTIILRDCQVVTEPITK